MKRLVVLALLLVAVVGLAPPAAAETHEVFAVDGVNQFEPSDVDAVVEDSVHWTKPTPTPVEHNVVQDAGLFVSGPPSDALDYTLVFSSGRFGYYCDVHGSTEGGMRGRVDVPPLFREGPEGLNFIVRWASPETQTGDAFDVRFKIGDGDWIPWKVDTEQLLGRFGNRDRPINVRANRTYSFQVRSQLHGNADNVRSRWSPTLVVET